MSTVKAVNLQHPSSANANLVLDNSGRVGHNGVTPTVGFDLSGLTDGIKLPTGTTAQRPTGANGMLRFN